MRRMRGGEEDEEGSWFTASSQCQSVPRAICSSLTFASCVVIKTPRVAVRSMLSRPSVGMVRNESAGSHQDEVLLLDVFQRQERTDTRSLLLFDPLTWAGSQLFSSGSPSVLRLFWPG